MNLKWATCAYSAVAVGGLYEFLFLDRLSAFNLDDDIHLHTYPSIIHYLQQIRLEGFPLWDQASFTGVSHLGTGLATPFNPLNYLVFVLTPASTYALLVAFHAVLAGVAMYFFLQRAVGYATVPSFLGGVIYQTLPLSRAIFAPFEVHLAFPVAYFPLAAAFGLLSLGSSDRKYTVFAALSLAAAVFAGTPLMLPALSIALFVVCGVGATAGSDGGVIRAAWTGASKGLAIVSLAAGLCAVSVLPFVVSFLDSMRMLHVDGQAGRSDLMERVLDLWHASKALMAAGRPNLSGISMLPALVGLFGLLGVLRSARSRAMRVSACVLALYVGFIGIPLLPGGRSLWQGVPIIGAVGSRFFLFLADFAVAIVVAAGAEHWFASGRFARVEKAAWLLVRANMLWLAAFILVFGVVFLVRPVDEIRQLFHPPYAEVLTPVGQGRSAGSSPFQFLRPIFQIHRWGVVYPRAFFGSRVWLILAAAAFQVVVAWFCLARRTGDGRGNLRARWSVVLSVGAAVTFLWCQTGETLSLQNGFFRETKISRFVRDLLGRERMAYLTDPVDYAANFHQFWVAGPLVFGATLPYGFAHSSPGRVMRLLFGAEFDADPQGIIGERRAPGRATREGVGTWIEKNLREAVPDESTRMFLTRADSPILDLFGVRFFISSEAPPNGTRLREVLDDNVLRRTGDYIRLTMYENPRRLPRAFIATDCRIVPSKEVIPMLASATVDPLRVALVEPEYADAVTCTANVGRESWPHDGGPRVEIVEYRSSRVTASIRPAGPGVLVLTDAFSRDWRVYVDDRRRAIVPVDVAFRGVPVDRGDKVVQFVFVPIWMYVGLVVSCLTAVLIVAVQRYR